MTAPGVFSLKTLNDNWFEDRLQPPGGLTATAGIENRYNRPLETDLAYIGERYDVLSRIGRCPNRASFATPDDGFRETTSTHLTDFLNPKTHPVYSSKPITSPGLINTANAPVCPPETRPLPGPSRGFGAALDRHVDGEDARFWNTASGDAMGYSESRLKPARREPSRLHASGVTSESVENRATGMACGQLCGEAFHETSDPSLDTRTQRSWLQGGDVAIRHIHLGGKKPEIPALDNHLSLPLGAGAMHKIRKDLKERQGRLCRVATNITQGAHQKSGVSLFQDD